VSFNEVWLEISFKIYYVSGLLEILTPCKITSSSGIWTLRALAPKINGKLFYAVP
jgi:hypothetical protein